MANDELLKFFLSDPAGWRKWRNANGGAEVDFQGVNLSGRQLSGSFLIGANLYRADLSGADLRGAQFQGAYCHECNFNKADLSLANFLEANLQGASFNGCNLTGAALVDATLVGTSMIGANLTAARLEKARLIGTDMTNANLTGARVYGLSAWDVRLDRSVQENLVVCKDLAPKSKAEESPTLITDSLELAQFLYLMMNNEKLRHIIETITSKVVLILGRFTDPYMEILNSLRTGLRDHGYLPVLFDFSQPAGRDLTETVALLAHMARFIVADISAPRSVPHELATLVPRLLSVPVQPLLIQGELPYAMFADLQRYPQVLPIKQYAVPLHNDLLVEVIAASERRRAESAGRGDWENAAPEGSAGEPR